tara:strand:- start:459 stop:572 length:114 start_codon:yes stop_codon:yes gene_type:complete
MSGKKEKRTYQRLRVKLKKKMEIYITDDYYPGEKPFM